MTANVAELVNELHAEAHRGQAALLSRYVELVNKAARKPLPGDEAAEAARLAYEMELPADRFERDLAIVKQRQTLEQQIVADLQAQKSHRARSDAYKARVDELKQELQKTIGEWARMRGDVYGRQQRREQLTKTIAGHPHLFADAASLTGEQWQALRQ